jgi:hypothetical protein
MNVATAQLVVTEGASPQTVLTAAQSLLAERHHIEYATLQVENAPAGSATRSTGDRHLCAMRDMFTVKVTILGFTMALLRTGVGGYPGHEEQRSGHAAGLGDDRPWGGGAAAPRMSAI